MSVEMKSTLEPAQGIDYRTSSIYKRVLPWHAHPDFCICRVEKGRMLISKGSISYFLQAGDVGFFNPNEIHNTRSVDYSNCQSKILNFNLERFPLLASWFGIEKENEMEFSVSIVRNKEFFIKTNEFLLFFEKRNSLRDSEEMLNTILELLIRKNVFKYKKEKVEEMHYYLYIKKYFDLHYMDCLSIKDLAKKLSISQSHLIRVFSLVTGFTPYQYLLYRRIQKAAELLSSGYSILDTVFLCKFSDQSSFTRSFKKFMGVSPLKFSKNPFPEEDYSKIKLLF